MNKAEKKAVLEKLNVAVTDLLLSLRKAEATGIEASVSMKLTEKEKEEALNKITATRLLIETLTAIAPKLDSELYFSYLMEIIREVANGPDSVQSAISRFTLMRELEESGVLESIKAQIEKDSKQECNCPTCQAKRALSRGKHTRTGVNGKPLLDS